MSTQEEWQRELKVANEATIGWRSERLGGVFATAYPTWNGVDGRQYWVVGIMPIEEKWLDDLFWRAIVDDFGQLVPIERI